MTNNVQRRNTHNPPCVDDFLRDVEVRQLADLAKQGYVSLPQLEHRPSLDRPGQEEVADQGPSLNGAMLAVVLERGTLGD